MRLSSSRPSTATTRHTAVSDPGSGNGHHPSDDNQCRHVTKYSEGLRVGKSAPSTVSCCRTKGLSLEVNVGAATEHQNGLDEREMRQNPGLSSSARAASSSTNFAAQGPSITSVT